MTPKLERITDDGHALLIDTQRVVTHVYGWPRPPFVAEYLGPDREDLLIAASHGARDGRCLNSETVERICNDYETVVTALNAAEERARVAEQQLVTHQGISAGLQQKLTAAEVARVAIEDLYETELTERVRIGQLHAEVAGRLARTAKERDQARAESIHLRHQIAGTTPAGVRAAMELCEDETIVVDADGGGR